MTMSDIFNESILSRKSEMYAMVIAIENDLINNFREKLQMEDLPQSVIEKSNQIKEGTDPLMSVLRGLDIQSYIEICNANIQKLHITSEQKKFINCELTRIIPIRNAVMHPRPLGYFDYPMLKAVFDDISNKLSCFSWEFVIRTKLQIKNDPESLIPPPESLKKNERIIENLPSLLDYEETSFIGRSKEIGEIRAQLNRRNVNILSIIGDGGVGKTATTLKLLYDMLDDPNCSYELIIWTSLKTNELSDHDFKEIENSIRNTSEMYERLALFIGDDSIDNIKNFIIELAQNFSTLFVLDNLETINTSDIKDFIDQLSEHAKVLITSRIGLGEMEHRYKLNGLNEQEVLEYANILLTLYGFEYFYTDEDKKHIFIEKLHSNPLAIKWFIKCLYNGQSEDEILNHKEDVINFCMENVYEKLSVDAHNVLDILTIAGVQLSFPELMYYLEGEMSDCTKIKYAINELGKCNFIDEEKFKRDKNIAVTDFAHEFLMLHYSDVKHLLTRFKQLEQKLTSFGQQLLIKKSKDNLKIDSIHYNNKAELVCAMYLNKALTMEHQEDAFNMIKYAQELVPMYFENNLISARIYGTSSPLKADDEYVTALSRCKNDDERIRSYIQYTNFLIKMNDYQKANTMLERAEKLDTDLLEIKLQKAKVLSYVGQFELAEKTLDEIDSEQVSNTIMNKVNTRRADIHRRRSDLIDIRETQKRLVDLRKAFLCLKKCVEPDEKVFEYMSKILKDLSYMYMDDDALSFILEIVSEHYQSVKKTMHYKEFKQQITEKLSFIKNDEFKKKIPRYIINYNTCLDMLKENEAVVYNLKQGYGFCKNKQFPQGLYFSMNGLPQDINYGDILQFVSTLDSRGRLSVVMPRRIGRIDDRFTENLLLEI